MPKITLNGRVVEAAEGQTILEVARKEGLYIPSLCYHPKVGQSGMCRVCAVEVEGARGFVMSCITPVTEGMVINTESKKVLEVRRTIVDLLLSDGEHECLSCEMCGTCELQDAAYHLGIEHPSIIIDKPRIPIDDSHPMLVRNPNKCIHCYRCIKACNSTVVNEVLSMGYRGHDSLVVADQNVPMRASSCVSCGECIQLCPTGALVEKKPVGTGRVWDLTKIRTTCPYCGVGCQLWLHVDMARNRVVKVTGDEDGPSNEGMLCVKGRFGYDFPASDQRLTKPLIKKDGKHVPVSWEEALDFTALRLKAIRDEFGADTISGISSSRDTNENNYAAMKFIRAVIGTNNIDNCART
jgi:predicted molibdopterin-dependent oxidoreductase YjgC